MFGQYPLDELKHYNLEHAFSGRLRATILAHVDYLTDII